MPVFLALIFFASNIFALESLDRIVLKIDLVDSKTTYFRIPLASNNCYQEDTHRSTQILTIYGEGLLQDLKISEEYLVCDVPGRSCSGYSFVSVDLDKKDPRVQFDLVRRDEKEMKLKYEAKLVYAERDNMNFCFKLEEAEHARIADIYKNKTKEALNKIRDDITTRTQVEFTDVEITDFTCDRSFEIRCSPDQVIHRVPRMSMTGYVILL